MISRTVRKPYPLLLPASLKPFAALPGCGINHSAILFAIRHPPSAIRHPPSVKVMVDIQQSSPSQSRVWVLHLGYDREKGAANGFWHYNPSPCRYQGTQQTTVTYGKRLQFSRTTHRRIQHLFPQFCAH
jgi:hypothetical protein